MEASQVLGKRVRAAAMWLMVAGCSIGCGDITLRTGDSDGELDPDAELDPDSASADGSLQLTLRPAVIDFGPTTVGGGSAEATIVVQSFRSTGELSLIKAGGDGFAVLEDSCSGTRLGVREECSLAVAFTPPAEGSYRSSVRVEDSESGAMTDLMGLAVPETPLEISPLAADGGSVELERSGAPVVFTVTNNAATLFTGPLSVNFSEASWLLTETACDSGLAPGESCTLSAVYVPRALGSSVATLSVSNGDWATSHASLGGTGVPTKYLVSASISGSLFAGRIKSSPSGINCTRSCSARFEKGTTVTLTLSGGDYRSWGSGACEHVPNGRRCTIQVNEPKSVAATVLNLYAF